jgi:RNA polymerase sigma factor (sigma-70 family)
LAGKYHGKLKLDEAIQEGNIGLIKAVDGFDWRKGFRFSSYAYQCIIREIKTAKRDRFDDIRIPAHMGALINKMYKTRAYMASDLGREPSLDELSAELNISKEELEGIISNDCLQPTSLNRQFNGADGSTELTLEDTVADQRAGQELVSVESMPNGLGLAETIKRLLNPPEAMALTYAYDLTDGGTGLTPRQIASLIENTDESDGVSTEMTTKKVRHLKKYAEAKLRHPAAFAALNKAAPNLAAPGGDMWKNQAECAAVLDVDDPPPLDIFFPLAEKSQPHNVHIAFDPREQFCGNCAVREECLAYGTARKGYLPGFWGGIYLDRNSKDNSQRLLKATDATD